MPKRFSSLLAGTMPARRRAEDRRLGRRFGEHPIEGKPGRSRAARKVGGVATAAEIRPGSCDVGRMPLADFVHLRVHTAYSLSAGAIRVKELVSLCKAERMPAVAVTDTGNLFGALEVATTCAAAGIQPIIGCEIALER